MAKDPDREHFLVEPADIASVLSALQRHNAPVSVFFRGSDQGFLSLILAVDRDQRVFYMDELSVAHAHHRMLAGEVFSVRGVDQGIAIFFNNCKMMKLLDQEEDAMVYKVAFPHTLMHNQKRDAFRAHVMRSMNLSVTLLSYDRQQPLTAELIDLSSTGCKLEFSHLVEPAFKPLEVFEEMTISLPEFDQDVTLAVEARHAVYHKEKERTRCGFRFIRVDGRTQALIDRFVVFLQREALRLDVR